jgi:hypothetical protein
MEDRYADLMIRPLSGDEAVLVRDIGRVQSGVSHAPLTVETSRVGLLLQAGGDGRREGGRTPTSGS